MSVSCTGVSGSVDSEFVWIDGDNGDEVVVDDNWNNVSSLLVIIEASGELGLVKLEIEKRLVIFRLFRYQLINVLSNCLQAKRSLVKIDYRIA